jgi:hypothetical protein
MVPIGKEVWPFWAGVIALTAAVTLIPTSRRRPSLIAAGLILVPFSGMFAALLYETGIRWFVRTWYYAPYALLAATFCGIAAHWAEGVALDVRDWLARRTASSGTRAIPTGLVLGAVYAVLAFGLLRVYGPQQADGLVFRYGWQTAVLEATGWMRENTEPDARFAAYNAGIPSYLSERTVVNLDGVVNRDAYHAAKDCTTRDYIREMRIDYVADTTGQFFVASCGLSIDSDLEEIARVGSPDPVLILVPKSTPP